MATIYLLCKIGEFQTATHKSKLTDMLKEHFAGKWLSIGNGSYLVASDEATVTQEISEKLAITGGNVGSYIVTKLEPYYGWGDKSTWEWVSTHGG